MNQASLAKAVGIQQSHMRKIERGEVATPGVDLALRIAAALSTDVETLFSRKAA